LEFTLLVIRLIVSILLFCRIVCFADNDWQIISGERTIFIKMQKQIEMTDLETTLSYNSSTSEIRLLHSKIGVNNTNIENRWIAIVKPDSVIGRIEMLFVQQELIKEVEDDEIECENLSGLFLLEKSTGHVWRLIDFGGAIKWQKLPVPEHIEKAEWRLFYSKNSIGFRVSGTKDIYSVFLFEKTTGTTYFVETKILLEKGLIVDKLVFVPDNKKKDELK